VRHSVTRALTALALGTAVSLMPAAARGEVIDRILAVVNRELITLSDVAAAIRLGLVSVPQQGSDPTRAVLDALIDRQLELGEANRYQPPEPAESQIQARMEAVRSRFNTPAAFAQALANSGVSEDQLMLRLREDLRIESYLNQRFGVPRLASEQELIDYYRAHTADFSTASGVRPFAEVREQIRARLSALQRASLVADWLTSLKRRTEIADLYVSSK
jgi:peptidyl-prolyl cis-trans isomerase SurA